MTDDDVISAARYLIRMAEKEGKPFTKEELETFDNSVQMRIVECIEKRIDAKPSTASHVVDSHGDVIASASNSTDAQKAIDAERQQG